MYKERPREGLDGAVKHCRVVVLFGSARILLITVKFPNFTCKLLAMHALCVLSQTAPGSREYGRRPVSG